ncbi:PREDICTED: nudix hydrolase 8 isoform X2 [Nicrophorus vespilloides]|nr:PREDICTED: nudix hydrolase 8 isoform X2 [Nicrophorus vespilloides]
MAFVGKSDRFNGVTVYSRDQNHVENFAENLQQSLEQWDAEKKRGVWFKVALEESDWIPVLAKNGFNYHHARDGYVMMYKWLPTHEASNIPPYAHTMLGVGAVVVNEKDDLLVVCERYNRITPWKLPGGYVEPGENFVDAAIREVYEETNIRTEFKSVLCLRHAHGGQFSCSDLYTVICLKPMTEDILKDDREIHDCKWMPIADFLAHPDIHELNKFFVQKFLDNRRDGVAIESKHGIHQLLKKPYTVYHASTQTSSKM